MRRVSLVGSLVLIAGCVAMYGATRGVHIPILHPAGPIALAERHIILLTFALASIIVLPVFFLLFYFAWRYRAHGPDVHVHHRPHWDHDNPLAEFFWWLVPSAIIAVLAVVAWQGSHALDPYVPIPGEHGITVQVVALEWRWLFIYPDQGIASLNELDIPAGVPVHFILTADAPMNTFWIPSLGGQIMAMPGMSTQLNLLADHPGVFDGVSGNLSGEGFADMTFKTRALSAQDFSAWVLSIRAASSSPLTTASYSALSKPQARGSVQYFFPIDQDLYTSVYMKFMSPHARTTGAMQMSL